MASLRHQSIAWAMFWLAILTVGSLLIVCGVIGGISSGQTNCPSGSCSKPAQSTQAMPNPPMAVVRVSNNRGRVKEIGGGVLIRNTQRCGYVLTCNHLFSDGVGRILVQFPDGKNYWANMVKQSKSPDLVLVKIRRPKVEPVRSIARATIRGLRVIAHGFRDGHYRRWRGAVVSSGTHLIISGEALSGDSGGPILDADGNLIGIIWGGTDGQTYAATAEQINEFLAGTLPTPPKTPTIEESPIEPTPVVESLLAEIGILRQRIELLESVANDSTLPIIGPPGPMGPRGPPGKDGTPIDLQTWADEHPINFELYDTSGAQIDHTTVSLGGTLQLQLFERPTERRLSLFEE